jgi:transglutaminase-like putative cysteine protease
MSGGRALRRETKVRLNIYLGLLSAIIATFFIIQLRNLRMTGDEAIGYFDGTFQSIHETAELALKKHENGRPVIAEIVAITTEARLMRSLHRRIERSLDQTESKLKRINASEKVKDRHRLFRAEFENDARSLFRRIRSVVGHYWGSYFGRGHRTQFKEELRALVAFLAEKEPQLLDLPLDARRLPHRVVQETGLECMEYDERLIDDVGATRQPPSRRDFARTAEVEFSDGIRELAVKLGKSPPRMFAYVRDSLDYEPYYGSLKGADRTLIDRAGNDFDLASLLVALLRASGIPSRYAYGQVLLPIEDLMGWVGGVEHASTAARILSASGIPATVLAADGDTVAVVMDHCWVEAFVDGARWTALDPSFKRYVYRKGLDISREVVFDEGAYLEYLGVRSPLIRAVPFMRNKGAPRKAIPSPHDFYLDAIRDFVETRYIDSTVSCAFGTSALEPQHSEPFPFTSSNVLSYFSEIPDTMRHRITFEVSDTIGNKSLSYTVSTPEMAGEPVLFCYLPATEDDAELAKAYHTMYEPPAYLLEVAPNLRIGGNLVATGGAIPLGRNQIFEIAFLFPCKGEIDRARIESVAGVIFCPVFDLETTGEDLARPYIDGTVNRDYGERERDRSVPNVAVIEEYLHKLGMWYFLELDECDHFLRRVLHMVNSREPSLEVLGYNVETTYLFGVPYDVDQSGTSIDTYRILNKPFSLFGDETQRERYNLVSGYESSYLMQDVWEEWRGTSGLSAVEFLQVAKQRRVPVYMIDRGNIEEIEPRLRLSKEALKKIRDFAEGGVSVRVPQRELVIGTWQGTGYIALNPASGDAAYKVRTEREAYALPPGSIRLIFEYSSVLITAVVAAVVTRRVRRRRRESMERERRRVGGRPLSEM